MSGELDSSEMYERKQKETKKKQHYNKKIFWMKKSPQTK